ncbi:MAG: YhbY family RNA-binding protein [Candidatus Howiella sp.]|jgi:RNA-binding protein
MLNSRQRAQLRGMANGLDTIFQIGKGGKSDALVRNISEALEARELIKARVLETAPQNAKELGREIAAEVGADVVQVIGSKFVLYRPSEENPAIVLVK